MLDIQPVLDMLQVHAGHYQSLGDYSVTTLLNPPRYVHLSKRHSRGKLNYRAMLPSFIGTGVHAYVEDCLRRSANEYKLEQRIVHSVEDRIISGAFDIFLDGQIYDIKTCKTWKTVYDPDMIEWHEQQNIYAWLLHQQGVEVKGLNIIAIYLDWIDSKAQRDSSYPQDPCVKYTLDLWPWDKTEQFMVDRIRLMKGHESTPDDALPECTREERFEDPTVYKCFKNANAKRSSRNCTSLDDAILYMKSTAGFGNGSYIEAVYAVRKRCDKYCEINEHCNMYRHYRDAKANNTLRDVIPYEQV